MIVQCEQCQTRFKIPDERVTDKGVKVRCTKCGNTFRVTKGGAAAGAADDPFARFASAEAPDPTKRTAEMKAVAPSVPPAPNPFPSAAPPPAASAFDFSSLVPGPPAPAAAAPPASGGASPLFDFSSLVPPSGAAPAAAPAPAAPQAGTGSLAFDFSALTAAPPPAAPPPKPARQEAKAADSTPAFDFSSLGSGPPPPPAASPKPARQEAKPADATPAFDFSGLGSGPPPPPAASPAAEPSAAKSALSDALPELNLGQAPKPASQAMINSLFGDDEAGPPRPSPNSAQAARDELFDMPAPAPQADAGPTTIEKIELGTLGEAQPVAVARLSAPRPSGIMPAPVASTRRTALGIVVNVVIALVVLGAVVLVGNALLNDGRVDAKALSPARLVELLSPPKAFIPFDISNGLYQTKGGRPLFYVRGQVDNHTDGAARAKVVVSLMNGDQVVRSGETVVGVAPSPEELYGLSRTDELEALQTKLKERAVEVAPGAQAPFVMAFFEYPPDLSEFRVKVAVEPLSAAGAP